MAIPPLVSPIACSSSVSNMSAASDLVWTLHLGQQDRVEALPGALDDGDEVVTRPRRRPGVDPYDTQLLTPVVRPQGLDDTGSGGELLRWRHGVLEVEEHLVGADGPSLLEHPRVAPRHREHTAPSPLVAHRADASQRYVRLPWRSWRDPPAGSRQPRGSQHAEDRRHSVGMEVTSRWLVTTRPTPTRSSAAAGKIAGGGVWPRVIAAMSVAPASRRGSPARPRPARSS